MGHVDFGKRSDDYAAHRPGFPASFYARVERFVALDGVDALDVGAGPGVVALELARRGARVMGVDIAEPQIRAARERADAEGLADRCRFTVAPAEQTGLSGAAFDLATAGQCWIWFDADRAMRELSRVLRPAGYLVVAHFCYLPAHDEVARLTEDLVLAYNPGWTLYGHTGLYPQQIDQLIAGGFELVEQFCYDIDQPMSHAAWRGRMRTCNGVGSGALGGAAVAAFDADLARLLTERFPSEPLAIRHRVWATVVKNRA